MMTPEEAREASTLSRNAIQAFRKKQALAAAEAAIALAVLKGHFDAPIFIPSDIEQAITWLESELLEKGYGVKRREHRSGPPVLVVSWYPSPERKL